ncbi:MAG: type II secretion system secretin GspD [Geminicoccaceae bacterium]
MASISPPGPSVGVPWKRVGASLTGLACLLGCSPQSATRPDLNAALPTVSEAWRDRSSNRSRPRLETFEARTPQPSPPLVVYGDGVVQGPPTTVPLEIDEDQPLTLNLVDVGVSELASKVLGDLLGVPYVIEDEIEGLITLEAPRPVPPRQVIALLESALAAKGAALIRQGDVLRLVAAEPGSTALRSSPVEYGAIGDQIGYANRILRLKHIAPSEMIRLLEPVMGPDATLSADDKRRLLMVSGSRAELTQIQETVEIFDVDWLRGMSFAMLPVRSGNVAEIASELTLMVADAPEVEQSSATRILPIERSRSILVVTPYPGVVDLAEMFMPLLDQGAADQDDIHVYEVQNRTARELADLVNQVFGGVTAKSEADQSLLAPGASPVSLSADGGEALDFAPAEPSRPAGSAKKLYAVADDTNNALILRLPPELVEQALAVTERLDAAPNQVLLEMTIAEVTLADDLRYGLEWFFQFGDFQAQFAGAADGLVAPRVPGLSLLLSGADAAVVLNALSGITDVNVISSPSIMVLDNRQATLQVGDQVPIVTQSAVSITDPAAPIVNSVSYRDTGVTMRVAPRVGDNGLVLLEIEQDVSDVVPTTTSGIDSPTIQQRRIATTVAVNDGESLALGGLIRDANGVITTGVPLLQDIPGLGELFKTTDISEQRTELLVMITPRVVRDASDAKAMTQELRQRMRSLQPPEPRL